MVIFLKEKIRKIILHSFWLFLIGGVLGFLIETLWHYYKYHEWINKQGLWYGPIKPIYGCGLILLTFLLYKKRNQNAFKIFFLGILIGSIYEYLTSCFQEYILGTSTWNYEAMNFNLNGRIYLPYSLAWGILTLLWIKYLFPSYMNFFKIIEKHKRFKLTYIFIIFLIYNITLTTLITKQYVNRANNINNKSKIAQYIDQKFQDDLIKKKFPKLTILKK